MKDAIIDPKLGELQDKVDRYHHNKMIGELQAELNAMESFTLSLNEKDWKEIIARSQPISDEYPIMKALHDYVRDPDHSGGE